MLDTATLLNIEARCTREPLPAIRGWRTLLEQSLPMLAAEEGAHAAALLLKLEHLERSERAAAVPAAAQAETYLAPELLLAA